MHNRLLAINYNNNDCLIHLRFDHEKMDVFLLDQAMQDDLHIKKFTISHGGKIVSDSNLEGKIDTNALIALYDYLLHQHPASMSSIAA